MSVFHIVLNFAFGTINSNFLFQLLFFTNRDHEKSCFYGFKKENNLKFSTFVV